MIPQFFNLEKRTFAYWVFKERVNQCALILLSWVFLNLINQHLLTRIFNINLLLSIYHKPAIGLEATGIQYRKLYMQNKGDNFIKCNAPYITQKYRLPSIPHFIVFHFIASQILFFTNWRQDCLSTKKIMTHFIAKLALLRWSGTKPAIFLRHACTE